MEKKIEDILKELDNFVQIKELELSDVAKDAPIIISAPEEGFIKLKALIADYEFQEKAEEIKFFKETKPKLFCKLIYYRKIYNIEINRPMCSYQKQIAYLENEQKEAIPTYQPYEHRKKRLRAILAKRTCPNEQSWDLTSYSTISGN